MGWGACQDIEIFASPDGCKELGWQIFFYRFLTRTICGSWLESIISGAFQRDEI